MLAFLLVLALVSQTHGIDSRSKHTQLLATSKAAPVLNLSTKRQNDLFLVATLDTGASSVTITGNVTFLRNGEEIGDGLVNAKTAVAIVQVPIPKPSGEIGRAVQQECRDRSRMPSSA
eukprot:TRINITY_DN1304_c0_g1_i11.p1 TRINITY_DN1304_c0_g1~~TRINITY_DN1304_c0_g1_i11.p1  ORF type:complete len:118 (+),score=13.55 TRINITY_DN1304_c0_g1_i11:89-442(+)